MASGMKRGLEVDTTHGRMADGKFDDASDLVLVDATLDRRHQRDVQSAARQPVQRAQFFLEHVRLAADAAIGLGFEAVELKIQRRTRFGQLVKEAVVACNALAVGIDHHERDAARLGRAHELQDLRMDGRLTSGELHHLGTALGAHEVIENLLDLLERQIEARGPRRRSTAGSPCCRCC